MVLAAARIMEGPDVNLLNDEFFIAGGRHGFFKGYRSTNHEVDLGNMVLAHLGQDAVHHPVCPKYRQTPMDAVFLPPAKIEGIGGE